MEVVEIPSPSQNIIRVKIPGIYLLNHPLMDNVFKIGCSTDIFRRVTDSCYRTMFLPENTPKILKYFSYENYTTSNDVHYLESCVHRFFDKNRIHKQRELFTDINLNDMTEIMLDIEQFMQDRYLINKEISTTIEYIKKDNDLDIGAENNPENNVEIFQLNIPSKYDLYHKPIVDKMHTYFDTNKAGKLVLACGYGKSYIALKYLATSNYRNVLVLVPNLLLLEQFINNAKFVLQNWNIRLYMYPVELNNKPYLTICTYQSAKNLTTQIFDFVIYDEAHRTCVSSKTLSQDSEFRNTLNLSDATAKKLFMTATQKIHFYEDDDTIREYISMEDPVYGDIIVSKTFEEAITEGLIADYAIAIPMEDTNPMSVVLSAFNELPIHHMLLYANSREKAYAIHELLLKQNVNSFYIDGQMTDNNIRKALSDFENSSRGVLCSVKLLQEGISLPFVDCVYFSERKS